MHSNTPTKARKLQASKHRCKQIVFFFSSGANFRGLPGIIPFWLDRGGTLTSCVWVCESVRAYKFVIER